MTNDFSKKVIRLFFALCFFAISYTYAQDLKFWHLTVNEGLSNSNVTCFLQDSKGFMWIGTKDGLNRYDGYRFEIYRHEAKNPYSLSNNYIQSLYEDSNQNIWIGTNGRGLFRYDGKYNRFIQVEEIANGIVNCFVEDTEKKKWAASNNLLYKLDEQTSKFIAFPQFTETNIESFLQIDSDVFFVATSGSGFYLLNLKTTKAQQFLHQHNNENSLHNNTILSIYKDSNQQVWIGTDTGLDRFDVKKLSFKHFTVSEDAKKSLLVQRVRKITGKMNEVWFASENGGLSKFDIKTEVFSHHLPLANNDKTINDVSIWSVYFDRQNRLWAGTFSGGVNIADAYREKFSKPNIILKNQTVNAILKDSKNRLWIGTEGGLAVREGENTTYYTHSPKQATSLANNPVLAIYEDNQNQIWIGTWDGGLSLFDEKNATFTNFEVDDSKTNKLSSPNIFGIGQSSQSQQIILASFSGLNILTSVEKQEFINYAHDPKDAFSIGNNDGKVIYEDSKKNIWVGTQNGLNCFNAQTKKFARYFHNDLDTNSISNNDIGCIYEDSKGRLWIGTAEGMNQMLSGNKFMSYTILDGLPSNATNGILEDSKGNLWISTNRGISMFNPETKKFRNYDESDGLQSKQFKAGSYFKSKDGQLFFGGVNGLNSFYPDSVKDNPHLPTVLITDLKIFNKSVPIGAYGRQSADSLLKQHISQTKEITLTYEYAVFSLDFVALNFTQSEKNKYAYRLEPFEKEWNEVGNKREATYTNLDAGTYTFQVKASNNDGVWNEEDTKLIIHILPPWWKTWWFRILVTSAFFGSAITFYLVRMSEIKKQNQKLERKVVARTQEVVQKVQEIEAKARDLRKANEEINIKNEELLTSEEELRQNMEELSTSQEELKTQKEAVENAFQLLNSQNTKVNDSIRYAQRIQNAILPHENILAAAFAEHFVIFKPKDVVSGDFYWYIEVKNKTFLAVVDCTGHGVPGAFMSMIGNTLLYEIINAKHIFEPNLILEHLHIGILNALNKGDVKMQDGMDIALCCIETQKDDSVKVQFSGAKRPLFYFSNNALFEIQSDKKSIGQSCNSQVSYTLHELILRKGDTLYMTTDGWIDATNPERKRFGSQQLREMLLNGANLTLRAQDELFRHILKDYEQGTEQRDDILLVGVRV